MEVHVLGNTMNNKIITTLLVSCLMQACTKSESTEKASSNTAQTETAKANTTDSQQFIEQGKMTLPPMAKKLYSTYLIKNTLTVIQPLQWIMLDSCASNLLIFFFTHGTFDS